MSLKEVRNKKGLTQKKCAEYLGISIRTLKRYEANEDAIKPLKLQFILQKLNEYGLINEEKGILSIEQIKTACKNVLQNYGAKYAYLFGSYAKNTASEKSDVDLLISVDVSGLKFFELVENLRDELNKKVDVLNIEQLNNNPALLQEILKDGIKIYG